MNSLKEITLADYTLWQIIIVFSIILLAFLTGKITGFLLKRLARQLAQKEMRIQAAFFEAVAKSITFLVFTLGFALSVNLLKANEAIYSVFSISANILIATSIGFLLYSMVEIPSLWFEQRLKDSEKNINKMFIPVIRRSLQISIVVLVIIQIIQILSNKPITSIIAGLGIGGLAVALAAQDTLKHFFGSMILIGDKPFELGDRVVIDGHDGPVEEVGFRSTRIRTLEGHVVSIPNGELANKVIQNIGKRNNIRRLANIGITYDTPPEKIKEALEILKKILDNHEGMEPSLPPKVYFNDLKSDSLNILVLYWYHPADYWSYMDFSERVNLEIIEKFNTAGIDFAFPTQTLFVAGDEKRPFGVEIKEKTKR